MNLEVYKDIIVYIGRKDNYVGFKNLIVNNKEKTFMYKDDINDIMFGKIILGVDNMGMLELEDNFKDLGYKEVRKYIKIAG